MTSLVRNRYTLSAFIILGVCFIAFHLLDWIWSISSIWRGVPVTGQYAAVFQGVLHTTLSVVQSRPNANNKSAEANGTKRTSQTNLIVKTTPGHLPIGWDTQCNDVLSKMVKGHWRPRNVTSQEIHDVKSFHQKYRADVQLPLGLSRADGRCGNVLFTPAIQSWWRALCDEDGDTPCCYNSMCVNKTRENCTCPGCLDLRQAVHAELTTWTPADAQCQLNVKDVTLTRICRVLDRSKVVFIGDSLARHAYTAFLLLVRGNEETGALSNNTPSELRSECAGLHMFTEKVCRLWLDINVTVCDGRVQLQFLEFYSFSYIQNIQDTIRALRNETQRTVVFMGLGMHTGLHAPSMQTKVLIPILERKVRDEHLTKPWIVWLGVHCPGLLKTENWGGQGRENVLKYNQEMRAFLIDWNIPMFDSFSMSDGVMSFDGTHYGRGLNKVKAYILLHYLQEIQLKGLWK